MGLFDDLLKQTFGLSSSSNVTEDEVTMEEDEEDDEEDDGPPPGTRCHWCGREVGQNARSYGYYNVEWLCCEKCDREFCRANNIDFERW